jgi:hypothetical protein
MIYGTRVFYAKGTGRGVNISRFFQNVNTKDLTLCYSDFSDPLDGVVGIRVIDLLCPVNLTMKSGASALAMLFKAKI